MLPYRSTPAVSAGQPGGQGCHVCGRDELMYPQGPCRRWGSLASHTGTPWALKQQRLPTSDLSVILIPGEAPDRTQWRFFSLS